jgi:hypothetical protein
VKIDYASLTRNMKKIYFKDCKRVSLIFLGGVRVEVHGITALDSESTALLRKDNGISFENLIKCFGGYP